MEFSAFAGIYPEKPAHHPPLLRVVGLGLRDGSPTNLRRPITDTWIFFVLPEALPIVYAKDHADYITITCLEWKPALAEDSSKNIIIDSLRFHNNLSGRDMPIPEDYYSSVLFYYNNAKNFDFLRHYNG